MQKSPFKREAYPEEQARWVRAVRRLLRRRQILVMDESHVVSAWWCWRHAWEARTGLAPMPAPYILSLRSDACALQLDLLPCALTLSALTPSYPHAHTQNERTYRRLRGRSLKGTRATGAQYSFRGKRWSVLPVVSHRGVLDAYIVQGSVNSQRLLEFAQHVLLPHLNPFPQDNSVLVLDNASTHRSAEFVQLVESTGALLVYLPAYSPEFSPVRHATAARRRCPCSPHAPLTLLLVHLWRSWSSTR
jgi:transposase